MTNDNSKKEEKVYYDEGNVKITSRRCILDEKTYVLKNISSVTVNTQYHSAVHHAAVKVRATWAYILGSLIILGGLKALLDGDVLILVVDFGIGGALCYYAYSKSQKSEPAWETPAWEEYSIRIGSNAGDADILESKDKDYITKIVDAINDAIIEN